MNDAPSSEQPKTALVRRRIVTLLAIAFAIFLPLLLHGLYLWMTALPGEVTLATGRVGGRHRVIMESLAEEIRTHLGIEVKLLESDGSLMNLRLLREKQVDFALYQAGAERMMGGPAPIVESDLAFVANLYSEVVHLIVRSDLNIPADAELGDELEGLRIAIGAKDSGDYAISRLLLDHFGLTEAEIEPVSLNYEQIVAGFDDGTLDAAVISVGVQAQVFRDLRDLDACEFRTLENIPALVRNHISVIPYTIPRGLYGTRGTDCPREDIDTIALRAQLLTRNGLPDTLIEEVIELALSEDFIKRHQLEELFSEGHDFARAKPEFAIHEGAAHYFDPELKPLLNSDFVEAMEGMRSFIVSMLIAGYLIYRWWQRRQDRKTEHRLDEFIRRVLEIERKQLMLDEKQDRHLDDAVELQKLLDEVTYLRQDALRDFSAHELNEDRALDSFLEMCHALSDKINAKLTRVRLDHQFQALHTLLKEKSDRPE